MLVLVCGLEAAAASAAVSVLLAGTARIIAWCALALAVAAWAWAGWSALARSAACYPAQDTAEGGSGEHGDRHRVD